MLVSDVNPWCHEDVLDVEGVPQRHLYDHPNHRDEQESGNPEAHRSPGLEDLFASAGKCRPRIPRGPTSDPPIEGGVTDDKKYAPITARPNIADRK